MSQPYVRFVLVWIVLGCTFVRRLYTLCMKPQLFTFSPQQTADSEQKTVQDMQIRCLNNLAAAQLKVSALYIYSALIEGRGLGIQLLVYDVLVLLVFLG